MNFLANFLTGLSLAFGFLSIGFSLESHFTFASWAILFSVVFDGLDGQVARLNPIPSQFGKEFDSLVDVISFGIAPSILGYMFVYRHFHLWATAALFVYLACSVTRLAKYNVTPKEVLTDFFTGLPTTASGGTLAAFILIYRRYTQTAPPLLFLFLVVILSLLMVSKVKYINLTKLIYQFRRSLYPLSITVVIIALVLSIFYAITGIFLPELILFILFALYITFSPFIFRKIV